MFGDDVYEVVILRYGTREAAASEVYLNHHLYHEPDAAIGMDYFIWVIRNSARTICVDTGFSGAIGRARGRTLLVEPGKALAEIDVDPTAVPTVVVTHAHYDHIGNLPLFPDSQLVLAADEYQFWMGPHRRRTQFHHSIEDSELEYLSAAVTGGRVTLFSGRLDLAPGVELVQLGGHTPGQTVVRVATLAGVVLIASDAVHYYDEYDKDRPFSSVADLVGMYAGFDTIRAWFRAGEVQHLVAGHDPTTLDRFPAMAGMAGTAAVIGRPPTQELAT